MTGPSIDQWITDLGAALRGRVDVIVAEELERMRDEAPAFFTSDDPDYVAAYTDSCVAHLKVLIDRLTSGRDVPESLPPAAVEETRTVAQWGISPDALVQTYRTAHAVIWEHAMDAAQQVINDDRVRAQVLKVISRFLFSYTDRMVVLLTEVYAGERQTLFHDRDRRRRQLVRDLLEGLPVDTTKLPYAVNGIHVAVIASGDGCERFLAERAVELSLSRLTVGGPSGSLWAWLGGSAVKDPVTRASLVSNVPDGIFIALGDPAEGEEGFRISHREARQAYRIGRRLPARSVKYGDVALLSLVTHDDALARDFVQRELGFLAEDDARAHELRSTLRAYFDTGHNASAAAARLNLNDRTVAYRLRTVEERLGRPLASRRDELSLALRLLEFHGASGPPSTGDTPDKRGA